MHRIRAFLRSFPELPVYALLALSMWQFWTDRQVSAFYILILAGVLTPLVARPAPTVVVVEGQEQAPRTLRAYIARHGVPVD